MVVFIGFSVLLVFGPVLPASALPPSLSSCLLPTLRFPIYVMCLTCCPCPFFVDLDQSSLPFCATLSFVKVSIVALRALFFTFDDNHLVFFLPESLHLLDWIYVLDQTVYWDQLCRAISGV